MPRIEISGPALGLDEKRTLAQRLTDIACELYGCPRDLVTVVIRAMAPDDVALGGTLICDRATD
jgi:4-oxalocrotonate tautomerase family enzyme